MNAKNEQLLSAQCFYTLTWWRLNTFDDDKLFCVVFTCLVIGFADAPGTVQNLCCTKISTLLLCKKLWFCLSLSALR